jgi:Ras-related protein Rab-18
MKGHYSILNIMVRSTLQDEERLVTREEGLAFAQECGCLFLESSAKTRENVEKCFEELALKVHP